MSEDPRAATLRLLVVDDHPVVRSGLAALLDRQQAPSEATTLEVVGQAGDADEALALAADTVPDVVLADLRLGPGPDGAALTAALRRLPRPPAVVILTTYDHDSDIVRAVEAGAVGYLLKDAPVEAVVTAVVDAAAGRAVWSPSLTDRIVTGMRTPRARPSDRETEVLRLVAEGYSNREIARALFISEATVKTHLVHLNAKLGSASRTEAVAKARRQGLLG